ncbi:MAG TPA: chorismate synthase, partial [Gemmatimonadales bacterium]|nr:chorismate synthase [Gemmatimonadales bacterium]
EGVPAGLPLLAADVDADLARRMKGYGRGARMKIEADRVQLLSGVRAGATLGSPITLLVENRDFEHWRDVMAPEPAAEPPRRQLTRPRPGHADLAGSLKYDRADARDILERASARETAARVAAGAVCRRLLAELGVEIGSHVVALGGVLASPPSPLPVPLDPAADRSPVRCLDPEAERAMVAQIDAAAAAGDTLGGVVEVVARGLVVGLGSHVAWDRRLDGRLAAALMSIPAVKGVEVGLGFALGGLPGSQAHDEIVRADAAGAASGGFARTTNRAGGLEGGMTTGEPLVLRAAMKPISTLMTPLRSVDLRSGRPAPAQSERSDVTAVPALGVIAEAAVALTLADAVAEKFGGDSLDELRRNRDGYLAQLERRRAGWEPVD